MGQPPLDAARWWRIVLCHGAVFGGVFVLAAGCLPIVLDPSKDTDWRVLTQIRLPGYALAAVVGGGLALAGVVFQALLHNPLASPYVLGVSAGGSLGAILAIVTGVEAHVGGATLRPLFALAGCVGAIALVYRLAERRGRAPRGTLLLAGVVVNASLSALILYITFVAQPQETLRIVRWLMGGIVEPVAPVEVATAALLVGVAAAAILRQGGRLNVLSLSTPEASSLGVSVARTRIWLFWGAALITAGAVSFTGPIGFVGLIVPHVVRLLIGGDNRLLLPCSFLAGAAFLVLAEGLAHRIDYPRRIPVGILTALAGGPFFLFLLRRHLVRTGGDA